MNQTKLAILKQVQIFWIWEVLTTAFKIAKKLLITFLSFPAYYLYKPDTQGLACAVCSVTATFLALKDKAFL